MCGSAVGHRPSKCKVASLIPSQGTHLGCGFGPGSGHIVTRGNPLMFVSHVEASLSLSPPSL